MSMAERATCVGCAFRWFGAALTGMCGRRQAVFVLLALEDGFVGTRPCWVEEGCLGVSGEVVA